MAQSPEEARAAAEQILETSRAAIKKLEDEASKTNRKLPDSVKTQVWTAARHKIIWEVLGADQVGRWYGMLNLPD